MAEFVEREIKLETIRRSVEECSAVPLPAIKEKLIAECSRWWGLRRQSSQELLNELVSGGSIFIDNENVLKLERWFEIEKAQKLDYKQMKDNPGECAS